MEQLIFYSLAGATVLFGMLVVIARNPVHSAIFLIGALMCIAGLYLQMGAEFVGGVQILVYVGGVMVLFLFVIMLVNVRTAERVRQLSPEWKTALLLAGALSVELVYLVLKGPGVFATSAPEAIPALQGNTQNVGAALYTKYLLPFEIASVLLLVAMIGAVALARSRMD